MIKNRKQMFIIIGVFALVLFLGGTTYAWFNYSRTTSDNELIAGEIYLHLNEGQEEIELTNIFPETAAEARSRNDNFITFTVDGKNTSNKTIYYEILLDHGVDKASPKTRYRDEDLRFDLVALDSNGDEDEYLLSAVSYETLLNRRIYVDTVNANTTTELERGYKLRMWLDENVVISDTAADKVYTTIEYPNKYATVKLVVAGDFQEKEASKSLYTIMRETAVMDNTSSTYVSESTGIDFGAVSSDTNGKGVYMRAGTENDTNPIMYYRGAVEDNNVLFNNFCWKAVRTTETGGIKLIYNGESSYNKASLDESDYNVVTNVGGFEYNSTDNTYTATITSGSSQELSFTLPAGSNYTFSFEGHTGGGGGTVYLYKGSSYVQGTYGNGGGPNSVVLYSHIEETITSSDIYKFSMSFSGATVENPAMLKIKVIHPDVTLGVGCDNIETVPKITVNNSNELAFYSVGGGPERAGYMYGDEYTVNNSFTSGAKFGSSFTWDGANYHLIGDSEITPDSTHHYSCNVTTENGTCTQLKYVFYTLGSTKYSINLTGGDGVEQALAKMQTNTNNSLAKGYIDQWYLANMTSYTNKLEDTIWCNDRSFGNGNNNGWIANGGSLTTSINYGARERSNYAANTSTIKNQPSLSCVNKNDAFTVNNGEGNQSLVYPVAMLTEDEMVLAGGVGGIKSDSYLDDNGYVYWSMSPSSFERTKVDMFGWYSNFGGSKYITSTGGNVGRSIRPSVALKSSTQIASGTGTATDPYVVE